MCKVMVIAYNPSAKPILRVKFISAFFLTAETIVYCAHHRPNTSCLNFGSYIWQNPIQLFDDIFHPFLEGGGCVCVKAIPSTAAAVKKYSCHTIM